MENEGLVAIQSDAEQQGSIQENQTDTPMQQHQDSREDRAADNFRRLREKAERVERERDEAMRRLQELEARAQSQQANSSADDDDISIAPDALAEGKDIAKVFQAVKKLKHELKTQKQQSDLAQAELRLKSQYSDFDSVVTKENIEALKNAYPDVAAAVHSASDLYTRASSAYTLIKKMGIYDDSSKYDSEKATVHKNSSKPKPMASLSPQQGDSALSHANAFANGLTPQLKDQLWKEMQNIRKNS